MIKCLTDWAGGLVAPLDVLGFTDTLFTAVLWCRIIAQAFPSLLTTSAGETA